MNIIESIRDGHRRLIKLLDQLESNPTQENIQAFRHKLALHEIAEEKVLYSKLENINRELVFQAYDDHQAMDKMLEELAKISQNKDQAVEKIKALKTAFDNHNYEKHRQMLELAEKLFDKATLEQMGKEIEKVKHELEQTGIKR